MNCLSACRNTIVVFIGALSLSAVAASGQAPPGSGVATWEVAATPDVSIGEADGPGEYLLSFVRDAVLLSDGTTVIAQFARGVFELRYFDQSGQYLASAGGWGDGPFEFRGGVARVSRLDGDSVFVASMIGRYSVFGPRGELGRSGRLPVTLGAIPWELAGDDHVVLRTLDPSSSPTPGGRPVSESILVDVLDLRSAAVHRIATVGGATTHLGEDGLFLHVPFDGEPLHTAGHGWVWTANSRDDVARGQSIEAVSGGVSVRLPGRSAVSRADERSWKAFDLEGVSGRMKLGFERYHRTVEFPQTMPAIQDMIVAAHAELWIQRYSRPWSTEDYQWEVFNTQGEQIATVKVPYEVVGPRGRSPLTRGLGPVVDITGQHFVVVTEDALGVQAVRLHRIWKAGTAPN
jgi:hypothetical protein